MGRKKNNDVQELLAKTEKEFKELPNNKTYFRLNAVISCLKNNIKSVSIITGIEIRTLFRWLSKYRKEGMRFVKNCVYYFQKPCCQRIGNFF